MTSLRALRFAHQKRQQELIQSCRVAPDVRFTATHMSATNSITNDALVYPSHIDSIPDAKASPYLQEGGGGGGSQHAQDGRCPRARSRTVRARAACPLRVNIRARTQGGLCTCQTRRTVQKCRAQHVESNERLGSIDEAVGVSLKRHGVVCVNA